MVYIDFIVNNDETVNQLYIYHLVMMVIVSFTPLVSITQCCSVAAQTTASKMYFLIK